MPRFSFMPESIESATYSTDIAALGPPEFLELFDFVCNGDIQSIKNMLCAYELTYSRIFNLKVVNKYGLSLMHSAAYYGQQKIIEFLLSSVNEAETGDAAIYEAITSDNLSFESNDTEALLADSKIISVAFGHAKPPSSFINIRSLDQGATPLHFASIGNNKNNIIPYLLACGADPRLKDIQGYTPQEIAHAHGHKKTEKTIIKYIRSINKKTSFSS